MGHRFYHSRSLSHAALIALLGRRSAKAFGKTHFMLSAGLRFALLSSVVGCGSANDAYSFEIDAIDDSHTNAQSARTLEVSSLVDAKDEQEGSEWEIEQRTREMSPCEQMGHTSESNALVSACFDRFPVLVEDTTVEGLEVFDEYGCGPGIGEYGPERVYAIALKEPGLFQAELLNTEEDQSVDVDLHILSNLDYESCLDRGHLNVGSFLDAGTYYLVADSWSDASGVSYPGDFEMLLTFEED